eukprot:14455210-Alexandrium_andersonii.AAC.1
MSASLVGSEMCIRDRHAAYPRAPCAGRGAGARGSNPGLPGDGPSGARNAVSYTHLTLPTICSV